MNEAKWVERLRALVAGMERRFGRGVVAPLPAAAEGEGGAAAAGYVASGIDALDAVLGGGLPRGAMVEVFGQEGVGKTSLALALSAAVQREGGVVAWIDVERALQPAYAARAGIDPNRMLLSRPEDAEEALELVEALARSGEVALIVVDSVAALVPRQEAERSLDDDAPGGPGRLLSRALPRLALALYDSGCSALFVNQVRRELADTGAYVATGGGTALRHYAAVRLEVAAAGPSKGDGQHAGAPVRVEVVKSRYGAPGQQALLALRYGRGFATDPSPLTLPPPVGMALG